MDKIQWVSENSESLISSFLNVSECETSRNDKTSDFEFLLTHCKVKLKLKKKHMASFGFACVEDFHGQSDGGRCRERPEYDVGNLAQGITDSLSRGRYDLCLVD